MCTTANIKKAVERAAEPTWAVVRKKNYLALPEIETLLAHVVT
jgi:hypothetical protein